MLIECYLRRKGGTSVQLGNRVYKFEPAGKDPRHVCEVADEDDMQTFLAIKEAYRIAKKEAAEAPLGVVSGTLAASADDNAIAVPAPEPGPVPPAPEPKAKAPSKPAPPPQKAADNPYHVDQRGNGNWFVKQGHKYVSKGFKNKNEAEAEMARMLGQPSG